MASKSDFRRFWLPFGSLLGPLGLFLGAAWDSLSALWRPLGDHFGFSGLRLALLLLFWHEFGYDLVDREVKIKESQLCTTFAPSSIWVCLAQTSYLHLSFADLIFVFRFAFPMRRSQLHLSSEPSSSRLHLSVPTLICTAHFHFSSAARIRTPHLSCLLAPLIYTSHLNLSFTPAGCASQLHPHLHHSCSPLVCTSLTYTCRWRLSVVPLTGTSHVHLSLAPFICTSHLFISVARFILLVISRFVLDDFG